VQGELFEFIEGRGPLEEPLARRITYQLLCGLQYLHSKGIVHRDMKPENVLLHLAPQPSTYRSRRRTHSPARLALEDQRIQVKIADFGTSKVMDEKPGAALGTFCGTAGYIAPEMFKGRGGSVKRYGPKVEALPLYCNTL
jgi:serine/threonine protein kinase